MSMTMTQDAKRHERPVARPQGSGWPIDLHSHSRASDGLLEPAALMERAAHHKVALLALTDHDSTEGLLAAREAQRTGGSSVALLAGVEISADFGRREIHLLGLGIDPAHSGLASLLLEARQARLTSMRRACDRLADCHVPIDREALEARALTGTAMGRAHLARGLVQAGHVRNVNAAFNRYLGDNRPARVLRQRPDYRSAIALIQEAGGMASLAHPGSTPPSPVNEEELRRLQDAGLQALELYHPAHKATAVLRYQKIATRLGLLWTGGSDHHGHKGGRPPGHCGLSWTDFEALSLSDKIHHGAGESDAQPSPSPSSTSSPRLKDKEVAP